MAYALIKKVVSYVIIASIFITGSGFLIGGITVEWYYFIYAPFAIYCLFVYHRFNFKIFIAIVLMAVYALLTYQYGLPLVAKQIVNISFSVLVFYCFLLWEDFKLENIAAKYLAFSRLILVMGFIQVAFFIADQFVPVARVFLNCFPWLKDSNISARFQSLTQEPSFLAYALAPVVFMSLYCLLHRSFYWISRTWAVLFILGYLLTFSLLAYVGLILMMLVLYFKKITVRKLSFSAIVFLFVTIFCAAAYFKIPEIKLRVSDTIAGVSGDILDPKVYHAVNLTTYSVLSNFYVTGRSLKDQPVFGTGLGTYELTYDRYLPAEMRKYSELNRQDANSLALRILTETGYLGFILLVFFLAFYRIRSSAVITGNQECLWIINSAILVLTLLFLIRSGNYTFQGKMFFLLLYYYTNKAVRYA